MIFVLAIAVGYLIGSINPAAIIARIRGVDYRSVTGEPRGHQHRTCDGAQDRDSGRSARRTEGLLAALGFSLWTGDIAVAEVAGLSAVVGHVTSPFLKGRGGKGVATSAGAILAIEPIWLIPVLVVFGVVFKLSHRMGIASVSAALTLIPASLIWNTDGSEILFACAMALLIVLRHQSNIRAAIATRLK